MLLARAHQVIE